MGNAVLPGSLLPPLPARCLQAAPESAWPSLGLEKCSGEGDLAPSSMMEPELNRFHLPGGETWGDFGCKAWFYFSWGSKGERQLSDSDLPVARKGDGLV